MISCLMAAWNAESTLTAAVRSVLAQTHQDLELIIVNDGSTDGTSAILKSIDDSRVVVRSQANAGPSCARNLALTLARGEYVACIDADDLWLPGKLALQFEALQQNPQAAVAYCWTDFVDATLRPLYPDERPTLSGDVYRELLTHNFISNGSNTLIRRAAIERFFDPELHAAEDWELHIRLAAKHAFVCVPHSLVLYRQLPHSLSTRLDLMERSFLQAATKVFADVPGPYRHLEANAKGSFYRYLTGRALQTRQWRTALSSLTNAARHDIPGLAKHLKNRCRGKG